MKFREFISLPADEEIKAPFDHCIQRLEDFLIANSVDFSQSSPISTATAIRWGFALTYFSAESLTDPYLSRFSEPFSNRATLDRDAFAELETAAFLLAMGATSILPIDRTHLKTYDFDLNWRSMEIEVEVTRAQAKDQHLFLREQSNQIADQLQLAARPFDLVAHLHGTLSPEDKKRLFAAAKIVECGGTIRQRDKWKLAGVPIARARHEIYRVGEDDLDKLPDWWPSNELKLFSILLNSGAPDSEIEPPRVKVCYTASFAGYINPAKRKARRFQGTLSRPYLVAVDVNNLPNSFKEFKKSLDLSFSKWKHISAVLIFEDYNSSSELGWQFQILINPFAIRPLLSDPSEHPEFDIPLRIGKKKADAPSH